jgi:TRAP transporter TAXI family solute receptor
MARQKIVPKLVLISFILFAFLLFSQAPAAAARLTLAAAPQGGSWYPMGAGLSDLFNRNIKDLTVTVEASGGSIANPKFIANNEAELSFVQMEYMIYAAAGKKPYTRKYDLSKVRSVMFMHMSPSQIMVLKSSPIMSIADMKGKRIAVGQRGSSQNLKAIYSLESAGLKAEDVKIEYIGDDQAAEALADRRVDAYFEWAGTPAPNVVNLTTTHDIRFIEQSDAELQSIFKKYPWFAPVSIQAGTYRGQDKEVKGYGQGGVLMARVEIPADIVYQMCKLIDANWDHLKTVHKSFSKWRFGPDIQKATGYALHPGALKFYKEKGLIK